MSLLRATLLAAILVHIPTLFYAQDLQTLFGTWRLDFAASTFASGPPAYKRVVCKIESWKDGLKVTYDMVGLRGGVTHWEWIGRMDGQDYPLQGVEDVVTNAYRQIGPGVYLVTLKADGRLANETTIKISPDGRMMTATTDALNARGDRVVNTAVYRR
jgi:hypothetical protein